MIFLLRFTRDTHFVYQQNDCIFPGSQNTGTGVKISFAEHHQFVLARATSLFRLKKIQVHGKPVMIVKCPYLSTAKSSDFSFHQKKEEKTEYIHFIVQCQIQCLSAEMTSTGATCTVAISVACHVQDQY